MFDYLTETKRAMLLLRTSMTQISPYTPPNLIKGLAARSLGWYEIIIKCLDPLRAKKTFIRKKLGHTMVSAIKASPVTL